jgi:hypothetical protein
LVDGVSGRVARIGADGQEETYSRVKALQGLGNALDHRAARSFIASCMDILIPFLGWGLMASLLVAAAAMMGGAPGSA